MLSWARSERTVPPRRVLAEYPKQTKKVLLRERKRHTTCRIASARCAALSPDEEGVPQSVLARGLPHPVLDTPSQVQAGGTPSQVCPDLEWGTPYYLDGVPPTWTWRMIPPTWTWHMIPPTWTWHMIPPTWTWDAVPPPGPGIGYPCPELGWGTPHLDLGWGIPTWTWNRVPPSRSGMWYPQSAEWGTPLPGPGMGYHHQLDGGTPSHLDQGWDTTPHHWPDGVPPTWIWDDVPPSRLDGVPLPHQWWTDRHS